MLIKQNQSYAKKIDFQKLTIPAINLLDPVELIRLKSQIESEATKVIVSINKIENLMQSILYNHKQLTKIEHECNQIFTVERVNAWKSQIEPQKTNELIICFAGTGNSIHLAGEYHSEHTRNQNRALAYHVPGVASDPTGQYDPDNIGTEGKIIGRVLQPRCSRIPGLTRADKTIKGSGLIESVQDAYNFIIHVTNSNLLEDDSTIILLGHSRGAVAALLLAKKLLIEKTILGNKKLKIVAHDPVLGQVVPQGAFTILNKQYNINELLYCDLPLPQDNQIHVTMPLAMSDMRSVEFAHIDLLKLRDQLGNSLSIELHPGHHNSALMTAEHINSNIASMKLDRFPMNKWLMLNFSCEPVQRMKGFHQLNQDYRYLMNHYYLLDDKAVLSPEVMKECIRIYSRWIIEDYQAILINPSFHAAMTTLPRYVSKTVCTKLPDIFYNQHHEELVRALFPAFYSDLIQVVSGNKTVNHIADMMTTEVKSNLPDTFLMLLERIKLNETIKHCNQAHYRIDDTSSIKSSGKIEKLSSFFKNSVLYSDDHQKSVTHAAVSQLSHDAIANPISADDFIFELKTFLEQVANNQLLFSTIHFSCSQYLLKAENNQTLFHFLIKSFCKFILEAITAFRINTINTEDAKILRKNISMIIHHMDSLNQLLPKACIDMNKIKDRVVTFIVNYLLTTIDFSKMDKQPLIKLNHRFSHVNDIVNLLVRYSDMREFLDELGRYVLNESFVTSNSGKSRLQEGVLQIVAEYHQSYQTLSDSSMMGAPPSNKVCLS